VLETANDVGVFFLGEITQVPFRLEIAERRTSQPDFAQIVRLELDHLAARKVAAPLQRNEQLLDFVQLYVIAREARDVMGKHVALSADIGHLMVLAILRM
jgi:hypothetical protein